MRFDELKILEILYPDIRERKDVFDIIKEEIGPNLGYDIEKIDFDAKTIYLRQTDEDLEYSISPLETSDITTGLSCKRVKKNIDNEEFSLVKNIVFLKKESKGDVIVSSLEKSKGEKYSIFYANTKNIKNDEASNYIIDYDNSGLWAYDNNVIDKYNELFEMLNSKTNFDIYNRLSKIEKTINMDYLLPDYVKKIELENNGDGKMVGGLCDNNLEVSLTGNDDIYYLDNDSKKNEQIFAFAMLEMKQILSIDTELKATKKKLTDYTNRTLKIKTKKVRK